MISGHCIAVSTRAGLRVEYIDALIPGVIGLLLLAKPDLFARSKDQLWIDPARRKKARAIGLVLLAVAACYAMTKFTSPH